MPETWPSPVDGQECERCRRCGSIKHVAAYCENCWRLKAAPDTVDELIAERRLHAAVEDGALTEDEWVLANLMRALLARGVSITLRQNDDPIIAFPATSLTLPRKMYAAVDRFYSRERQP